MFEERLYMRYDQNYWDDVNEVVRIIPSIDKLKKKSVLITGGTGLIGSAVVDILVFLNEKNNMNIKIYVASRSRGSVNRRFPGFIDKGFIHFYPYEATKDTVLDFVPDYIIHAASNASPDSYTSQPVETILGNVIGLNSLLSFASKHKVKRVLYVSSSEVYGKKEGDLPFEEFDYGFVDPLNTRSCYPNSKRLSETLCVSYYDEYDVDVVMVRPGHIYGPSINPKDNRASAFFSRCAANGENIIMKSDGSQLRSYMHSLDCASAILVVLLYGKTTQAYNLSNPSSIVTVKEMAQAFAKAGKVSVIQENASAIELKGFNPMSNSSLNSKRLESLGWRGYFDMNSGALQTIRYLKDSNDE